ncbi:MAG: GNAT family N-acetyltransferase [Anaerolineae bacterium]|nr:GNAT family N-acetyltransferase [Anaerolineae bacterium]
MIDRVLPQEQELLVACTRATGFFNSDEVESVRRMLDEYFETPDADEYTWIAFRAEPGGPPLGFACYGPASLAVGTYDLYWIVVDRDHQDKKIGSALLEHMEHDLCLRRARQVYVETSDKPQYAPTRAFYERRGYALAAHFRDYYEVGDGKVIYRKLFGETVK